MNKEALHLRHARAYVSLLRGWEKSAGLRGQHSEKRPLESVLEDLDASWFNIQKAQQWCAKRARDLKEAAVLCRDFASVAPDLVSLRLLPLDWLGWLEVGLASADQLADETARLQILGSLGQAHLKNGDSKLAHSCFEQQLTLAERQGDPTGVGKALCGLANTASLAGHYEEASRLYERSLQVARELRSDQLEGDILGNLAILLDNAGQPEEAMEVHGLALEIARRIGDRAGESRHLGNLAGLSKHVGELDRATELYREQLAIVRSLEDRRAEARVLHNMGLIHLESERLNDAAGAFEEARALRRKVGDWSGEGRELGALGIVLRRKGDRVAAIAHLQQWLEIARNLGDRLEEAEALNNLGNAAADLESSREFYEAALAIVRDVGHPRGWAILLGNLGRVYDLSGETEKARELIAESLEHHRQAGNRIGEARSLWHLAKISYRIGNVTEAFHWGYQALDLYHEMKQLNWVLDLVYLMGNWILEVGNEGLRQKFEERAERILSDFSDIKVEWIRNRSGLNGKA